MNILQPRELTVRYHIAKMTEYNGITVVNGCYHTLMFIGDKGEACIKNGDTLRENFWAFQSLPNEIVITNHINTFYMTPDSRFCVIQV
jgi:hypothetical protein